MVQACRVPCKGDTESFFTEIEVPDDHPVFTQGALSSLSLLIEVPLRVWRLEQQGSGDGHRSSRYDNQFLTYLMFSPRSGFAPPEWQHGVGTVIVARADRKPLPSTHLEAIWMFASSLLDKFGSSVPPTESDMTRDYFEPFYSHYRNEQLAMYEDDGEDEGDTYPHPDSEDEAGATNDQLLRWQKADYTPYEV